MAKDINNSVFDEATKLKLDIFGECFEEWFPVFLHSPWYKKIYVFDFFAGSGKDLDNNSGSPLVLLDKAKGTGRKYCINSKKEIKFLFNEGEQDKSTELKQNVAQHIEECKQYNNCTDCIYQYRVENYNFQEIFTSPTITKIFKNKEFGKFILLDQYGFSQIDEQIFKQLIAYQKTDFIFFISSSFISRFREHPNTTKYIDTSKINFNEIRPNEIHRAVAKYFRDLIPQSKEYYLHHFTIQKEDKKGNYYGLIFGSSHSLGMEKFLKVCWKHDAFSGEANFNIDNNYEKGTLFEHLGENVKKDTVSDIIKQLILSGEISDNITGLKFAMHNGCEPKLFTEVVQKLEKEKLIERIGEVNNKSSIIHRAKTYHIKRLSNGA
ncbi:MAG: three-Cys-motif partner protein TcmP [Bacteroidetes bacterium]|jgi:three-Cys-motif partner protein|nr:three-Cys-motif partner protein TcmP [Bacteroidota bacterium]MBT7996540.1 three-Cys-motif partner protein TcmP [Bacteroidota bacterium]